MWNILATRTQSLVSFLYCCRYFNSTGTIYCFKVVDNCLYITIECVNEAKIWNRGEAQAVKRDKNRPPHCNFFDVQEKGSDLQNRSVRNRPQKSANEKQFGDLNVDIHLKTVQILVDCLVFSVTSLFHASCFGRIVFPLMPNFVHESRVMGFPNSQQHFAGSGCLKAREICTSRATWFGGLLSFLLSSSFHRKRPKNTHVRQDI